MDAAHITLRQRGESSNPSSLRHVADEGCHGMPTTDAPGLWAAAADDWRRVQRRRRDWSRAARWTPHRNTGCGREV